MRLLSRIFRSTRIDADYTTHVNPDGSSGGSVATDAQVEAGAKIDKFSVVLPKAKVRSDQIVKSGDVVLASGTILRFD